LNKNHPELLSHFETDGKDRTYQFWKRRSLSIELRTHKVYLQKLNYILQNPVKRTFVNYLRNINTHLSYYTNRELIFGDFFLITVIDLKIPACRQEWRVEEKHPPRRGDGPGVAPPTRTFIVDITA